MLDGEFEQFADCAEALAQPVTHILAWQPLCKSLQQVPIACPGEVAMEILLRDCGTTNPERFADAFGKLPREAMSEIAETFENHAFMDGYVGKFMGIAFAKFPECKEEISASEFVMRYFESIQSSAMQWGSRPLAPGATLAMTTRRAKSAALWFDRVWTTDYTTPSDIAFRLNERWESVFAGVTPACITKLNDCLLELDEDTELEVLEQASESAQLERLLLNHMQHFVAHSLEKTSEGQSQLFCAVAPGARYRTGSYGPVCAELFARGLMPNQEISWEEVRKIRSNPEIFRLRAFFFRWLDAMPDGTPIDQIMQSVDRGLCLLQARSVHHRWEQRCELICYGLSLIQKCFSMVTGIDDSGARLLKWWTRPDFAVSQLRSVEEDVTPFLYIDKVTRLIQST